VVEDKVGDGGRCRVEGRVWKYVILLHQITLILPRAVRHEGTLGYVLKLWGVGSRMDTGY